MDNSKDKIVKKLLFRSMHRGTKEMDIILGNFAGKHLMNFQDKELVEFEKILEIPDDKLFNWYMGNEEIPESFKSSILNLIMNYKLHS